MIVLLSLFAISFLSSTLLPGGSEAYFLYLISDQQLPLSLILIVATIGNTLGGMTNFIIGLFAHHYIRHKDHHPLEKEASNKIKLVEKMINRWGYYALLLSWLPIIGDLICLVAGWYKLDWKKVIIFVFIGKGLRYLLLTILV